MATKTFKVALSLDNPRIVHSGIDVRSFDKQSIKIAIELTKNSQAYPIPTDSQIKISLLKLARKQQKIILDVPFTSPEAIEWLVPDILDGYRGEVRVGVYLIVGDENIDVGYFNISSNVSDIDKAAEEFTDSVMPGWEQMEADLAEIRDTVTQANTIAIKFTDDVTSKYNAFNETVTQTKTSFNDTVDAFTADVTTKQTDVTNKYNEFDTSVTQAGKTIDEILALQPQFQSVLDETTGKDVISGPEIILARGGATTLGERLDNVSAQLENIKNLDSSQIVDALGYTPISADDVPEPTWTNLQNKPTEFNPTSHTHGINDVTGLRDELDSASEVTREHVETALGYSPLDPTDLTWDNLSNKPTMFTPSAHSHSWEQVTGKPSTFTPSAHTHTIADVTGLQSAINEKAGKEVATTQVSGLMSSSDKTKLNGLSSDATTLQGRTPSNFVEVVNHGTSGNYARPVGGTSVLWIGTVEPQNALDNDIWIGGV